MTWNSRLDVIEALESAGWTGDEGYELSLLRHPSGAVFGVTGPGGECSIDAPGGVDAGVFSGDTPDAVLVAAALAASGQLAPHVNTQSSTGSSREEQQHTTGGAR